MTERVSFLSEWMAVQAVPRLAEKAGSPLDLPEERTLYGMPVEEIVEALKGYEGALGRLMEGHGFSWRDVYEGSDVGRERLALAEEIGVCEDDTVLDVGCGKGYLTIALATRCKDVCGLDLMDGFGRRGWWADFRAEMGALGLGQNVRGARASAAEIPFRDGSFSLTASAHALRNFQGRETVVAALREMRRVTRGGGRVVVAENLPVARTRAQEAHLRMFDCRVKHVMGDRPLYTEEELVRMFEEAGMTPTRSEVLDFGLSAAPPMFVLNEDSVPEEEREEAIGEYREAVDMIRLHGESSTPVLLLEAEVN